MHTDRASGRQALATHEREKEEVKLRRGGNEKKYVASNRGCALFLDVLSLHRYTVVFAICLLDTKGVSQGPGTEFRPVQDIQ